LKTHLLLFLLHPFFIYCQDTVRISLNSKLNFETKELNYSFHFIYNGTAFNIMNQDINDFEFKKPGIYRIETKKLNQKNRYFSKLNTQSIPTNCGDAILPELFYVHVDSLNFIYNPESIYLTKPICINEPCEGNSMYIDIEVQNYYNTLIFIPQTTVYSAGIGTSIVGILDSAHRKLMPGRHRIKYDLVGSATAPSFIQFDFYNIPNYTPIGLKEKIRECAK